MVVVFDCLFEFSQPKFGGQATQLPNSKPEVQLLHTGIRELVVSPEFEQSAGEIQVKMKCCTIA